MSTLIALCRRSSSDIRSCLNTLQVCNEFRLEAAQLEKDEEAVRDELCQQTSMTDMGEYNLILEGLKEFQDILKFKNKTDSKRPHSSVEYAFWKTVKSRAGGKLEPNNSDK